MIVTAEPYRPYPIITIHGYNANGYDGSNFGITILSSDTTGVVQFPTTPSPVPATIDDKSDDYYISRNEGKRIEYNKLAWKMAELNKNVLDYWNTLSESNKNAIYWIKNDIGLYNQIPYSDTIMPKNFEDTLVARPINCFLETMEFDYPEIGSSTRV